MWEGRRGRALLAGWAGDETREERRGEERRRHARHGTPVWAAAEGATGSSRFGGFLCWRPRWLAAVVRVWGEELDAFG
jgi:hypothetical protein